MISDFNFFFSGLFRSGLLSEYVFREQSHALTVLHGLNEQRKTNTLCDVIICVDDQKFPCHRNIMAACSPYFLAMFTGDNSMHEIVSCSMYFLLCVCGIIPVQSNLYYKRGPVVGRENDNKS